MVACCESTARLHRLIGFVELKRLLRRIRYVRLGSTYPEAVKRIDLSCASSLRSCLSSVQSGVKEPARLVFCPSNPQQKLCSASQQ
jgi:hypothetical protein